MKIAVLSDIHDHIENLKQALGKISSQSCESIIFCGDFCAPFTARRLAESNLPIYSTFGNNDGDQGEIILSTSGKIQFFSVGKENGEITLAGRKIAFCHYPKYAKLLAESGQFDAVFYGHNHLKSLEKIKKTILCNPGAVCGIVNGEPGTATFVTYDTDTDNIEFIPLS